MRLRQLFSSQILLVTLMSCSSQAPLHIIEADRLAASYVNRMKQAEHMEIMGSGGRLMYNVDELDFMFRYPKFVDLKEARSIIVRSAQVYLELVNSDENIRPYLKEYPVGAKGVELTIVFTPSGSFEGIEGDYVRSALFSEGKIYYRRYAGKSKLPVVFFVETYEEAVQQLSLEP